MLYKAIDIKKHLLREESEPVTELYQDSIWCMPSRAISKKWQAYFFQPLSMAIEELFNYKYLHRYQEIKNYFMESYANHPRVIQPLQMGWFDQGHLRGFCVLMHYLPEGKGIYEFKDLSLKMRLAEQLVEALAAIHETGYPHGKFKERKIRVCGNYVFIESVGMALIREISNRTEETQMDFEINDFFALSWEKINLNEIPGKTYEKNQALISEEVYTLGTILYKLFTGIFPYQCKMKSGNEIIIKLNTLFENEYCVPRNISYFEPLIPAAWEIGILKALAPKAENRLKNASELLEYLKK